MEYMYFPHEFFTILHTSMDFMFIYCRHKSTVHTTYITLHRIKHFFSFYLVKYLSYWKLVEIKGVELNEIYTLNNVAIHDLMLSQRVSIMKFSQAISW
jgi:hypothetical protein